MTPLIFWSMAVIIPLLGMAVLALVKWLRRERWDDGIKVFEQNRRALERATKDLREGSAGSRTRH